MDIPAKKLELINWITNLEDPAILEDLQSLKNHCHDATVHWDDLPESVKRGIERGRKDIEEDRFISDAEFWKKHEQRL